MSEQPARKKTRLHGELPPQQQTPWMPPEIDPADATALRAVYAGTANEQQQRRAMDTILKGICGIDRDPFVPGAEDGARATLLALGKQSVGRVILSLVATRARGDGEQG